jgi:hypothetical protein
MSKQPQEEKPATIRIENLMQHGLSVPLPGPGKSYRGYVKIPAGKGEEPGVVETDQFDAVTVNRLRYHYDWRPTDPKLIGKKRSELAPDQVTDVGLMRITIVKDDEKPKVEPPKAEKPKAA